MDVVRSKDGTLIAFQKSGTGAPLVLVHGTSADHTRWASVLLPLASRFTVYVMDRRGRGGSGDTDPYVIEREFEDVVAVLDSLDEPVNLLGHSYGAICALEAAARSKNLRRLILYEPPIPTGVDIYSPAVVNTMRDMLAGGDRDGVVATFMREVPRVPPHELELLRSSPAWQGRVAAAHTIFRELEASNDSYRFDPLKSANVTTPTLLLLGGASPAFFLAAINKVHEALPNSRIVVMPGQQHTAMNTAPELFVREVLDFLTKPA
jgi:pimeloyl-ACP methyl ester carboxylesterase